MFERARLAGIERAKHEPRVVEAHFDRSSREVVVVLDRGSKLIIPTDLVQGLEGASLDDLSKVEILPVGIGIRWADLDVDATVSSLAQGVFGTDAWMSELARRAGRVKSEAKALAARANGRKGGRPRRAPAT